jgi:hypothetical protein
LIHKDAVRQTKDKEEPFEDFGQRHDGHGMHAEEQYET